MTVELDFDWTKSDEEDQVDRLNRGKYAQFLTGYLSTYTDACYVMNLNAEWGAGKTWFLKRWQQTIQYQHPTAYIDAWQNDFSDDPLLTVIAGISEALKTYPNVSSYQYTTKIARTGGRFLKQAAPAFLNALMKHYTGFDSGNFKLEDFSDFAEKALAVSLDDHNAKVRDIEGFKRAISDWINKAVTSRADGTPIKPMFVFIDELDRCRPTYAIELLETVKHLFDIPGLVFVIATNTDQLQHSIKAVYGQEFDAQRYLYRFFNRSFALKTPDLLEFVRVQPVFKDHLLPDLQSTCGGEITTNEDELTETLTAIAEGFAFDLRTTLQWLEQLSAIFSDEDYRNRYFWLWLAIMLAVKLKSPHVFSLLFVQHKVTEDQKFEVLQSLKKVVGAMMALPAGKKNRNLRVNISAKIAHEYRQIGPGHTKTFYLGERTLDEALVIEIADKLVSVNFKEKIRTWPANSYGPDPKEAISMAAFKCLELDALREGYVNLVELASDLE